ncbi:hypothetical protein F2P81_016196 [Scophthalmus maximus]|uniref:Centrosomin N-terminal motif 1 domain-containing protein n=1 Tax=Scophthalmus maximus TaxID=52904 RepID=A0A6A4SKI3_SCOMX|nr:hypothetical protein F2P81_016196 [Scophthalmus maximus]
MDSVVGDDVTLPVDINGRTICQVPDTKTISHVSMSTNETKRNRKLQMFTEKYCEAEKQKSRCASTAREAPSFPDKMSPIKALTMKDYENQITALKKENFNLKLRIYFMEERMQQKCDDSTEDIFKTNIELKVELESMKREMAEKQELLVSASKALESLAGRESGEPQRLREQAQREMDALRDAFHKRIADLEQCLQTAEEEVEKMAAIAEQEKRKNIDMEKQLHALGPPSTFTPVPVPSPVHDLQQALQEKDNIIEQLKVTLKNQEALIHQEKSADQQTDAPSADCVKQLSDLIAKKDQELAV